MKELTLIHAHADTPHAQEFTRQLFHATRGQLRVYANDDDSSARDLPQAWQKRLGLSHLFVILVSADLTSDEPRYRMVQDAIHLHPERCLFVYLRPCWLVQGKFEGYTVIPTQPLTSYSGAAKEKMWVSVVEEILEHLAQVSEPEGYREPSPRPTREPEYTPHRKFVPRREEPGERTPPPIALPKKEGSLPEILHVAILFAPQDQEWLQPVGRIFRTMQIIHRGMVVTFDHHPNRASIREATLTLALVSPDFLASEQYRLYRELMQEMIVREKAIVPILIRACAWEEGTVYYPQSGPVKRIGNDTAWAEVSAGLRKVLMQR